MYMYVYIRRSLWINFRVSGDFVCICIAVLIIFFIVILDLIDSLSRLAVTRSVSFSNLLSSPLSVFILSFPFLFIFYFASSFALGCELWRRRFWCRLVNVRTPCTCYNPDVAILFLERQFGITLLSIY